MSDAVGSANPLSFMLGVRQGRNRPIRDSIDPEAEARLRKQYVGMLVELEKADTSMKNAQVSTFGNIANAMVSAAANAMAAAAEAAKAGAMTDEAIARGMEASWKKAYELAAVYRAYEVPPEQAKRLEEYSRQAANQGSAASSMPPAVIQQRLAAIQEGDKDGQYQAIAKLLDQSYGEYFNNNASILNHIPVGTPQRIGMVDAVDQDMRRVSGQILTQKLQAAGYSTAMVPEIVDRYVKERSFFKKLAPGEVEAADQKALQGSKDLNEIKDFWMSKSAGMDPELRKRTIDALDVLGGILGGGVQGFGKVLAETPSTPGVIQARDIIQKGMLSLEGKPDPLNKAVDDMWGTVPGFAMWAEAKGFGEKREGREKAALYASKHPDELLGWVRATREDSSLLTDPQAALSFVNPGKSDAMTDEESLNALQLKAPPPPWSPGRRTGQTQQDASRAALDEETGEGLPEALEEGGASEGAVPAPKPAAAAKPAKGEAATVANPDGSVTKGGKTYPVGSPEWFATHPEAVAGAAAGQNGGSGGFLESRDARATQAADRLSLYTSRPPVDPAEVAELVNNFDQGEASKQAAVGPAGVRTEPLPPGMAGPFDSSEERTMTGTVPLPNGASGPPQQWKATSRSDPMTAGEIESWEARKRRAMRVPPTILPGPDTGQ